MLFVFKIGTIFLILVHHRPSTTTSNTHQGRIRVLMRREDPSPSGLTSDRDGKNEFDFPGLVGNIRSELFIQGTGPADNGTYRCQAENKERSELGEWDRAEFTFSATLSTLLSSTFPCLAFSFLAISRALKRKPWSPD